MALLPQGRAWHHEADRVAEGEAQAVDDGHPIIRPAAAGVQQDPETAIIAAVYYVLFSYYVGLLIEITVLDKTRLMVNLCSPVGCRMRSCASKYHGSGTCKQFSDHTMAIRASSACSLSSHPRQSRHESRQRHSLSSLHFQLCFQSTQPAFHPRLGSRKCVKNG